MIIGEDIMGELICDVAYSNPPSSSMVIHQLQHNRVKTMKIQCYLLIQKVHYLLEYLHKTSLFLKSYFNVFNQCNLYNQIIVVKIFI